MLRGALPVATARRLRRNIRVRTRMPLFSFSLSLLDVDSLPFCSPVSLLRVEKGETPLLYLLEEEEDEEEDIIEVVEVG